MLPWKLALFELAASHKAKNYFLPFFAKWHKQHPSVLTPSPHTGCTMLSRLQGNGATGPSSGTSHDPQVETLRREQRERWRMEGGEVDVESGGRNVVRNVRDAGDTTGAERPAPAPSPRTPQNTSSRGLLFGAALTAGVLGYQIVRAFNRGFTQVNDETDEASGGARETQHALSDARRKREQEAADAALAFRLQREETVAYAQHIRATRDGQGSGSDTGNDNESPTVHHFSLGPFGVLRVETASSSRSASASSFDRREHSHVTREFGNPEPPGGFTTPIEELLNAALRAHGVVFGAGETGEDEDDENDGQGPGAGDDAMRAMPMRTFTSRADKNADGSTSETPTCAVCLCDAEQGDCLRRLPCCHEFHAKCVDRWLVNHTTCPMCKHDVRRGEGRQGR